MAEEGGTSGGGATTVAGGTASAATGNDGNTRDRVADLRAELAAERVAKRQSEEKLTALQADLEKAKAEVESKVKAKADEVGAKLTKMQQRVLDAEIKAAAQGAGLVDMDLLPLLDRSSVKVDDDGNATGITEAFEALKGKKPEWFKAAGTSTGTGTGTGAAAGAPTGGASPAATGGTGTPVKVAKLSPEEYRKFKADQLRSLRH